GRTRLFIDAPRERLAPVALRQLLIERLQELAAALRGEEPFERGECRLVFASDALHHPREQDLAVAAFGEFESRIESRELSGRQRRRQRAQELLPLLRRE